MATTRPSAMPSAVSRGGFGLTFDALVALSTTVAPPEFSVSITRSRSSCSCSTARLLGECGAAPGFARWRAGSPHSRCPHARRRRIGNSVGRTHSPIRVGRRTSKSMMSRSLSPVTLVMSRTASPSPSWPMLFAARSYTSEELASARAVSAARSGSVKSGSTPDTADAKSLTERTIRESALNLSPASAFCTFTAITPSATRTAVNGSARRIAALRASAALGLMASLRPHLSVMHRCS